MPTWKNQYGADANIIGRTVYLRGHPLEVVGVASQEFVGLASVPADFWIPLGIYPDLGRTGRAGVDSAPMHEDSILAVDMTTGAVRWFKKLVTWSQAGVTDGSDDWNVSCLFGVPPGTQVPPAPTTISPPPRMKSPTKPPAAVITILGVGKRGAFTIRLIRIPAPNSGIRR
jgi:hypothetical protein